MAKIRELFVVCGFCSTKFSSKAFADSATLETALAKGHSVDCVKCGKQILCNKSNTSYTVEESAGTGGIDFS